MSTEFDPTNSSGALETPLAVPPGVPVVGADFGLVGDGLTAGDGTAIIGGDEPSLIIRPPVLIDPNPLPDPDPFPLPLPIPVISSVQPAQIPAGFTASVIVGGSNLPVSAARYTVINAQGFPAGVPVLGASGSSTSVTLTLSPPATTPAGQYRIRVESNGFTSEGLLQIVGSLGPRIDFVQPNRIPAGATSTVVATGLNLPTNAGSYSVVGQNGFPVPGTQVLSAFGSPNQVSLQIGVAATTLSGSYFLRVSVTGSASQVPLQIDGANQGPVLTSLQPSTLGTGATTTVLATGTNLPGNAFNYRVINSTAANAPGFQVVGASGGGTQVTLQISVAALTPAGNYRLRVESAGAASEALIQVVGGVLTITSVQPSTIQAGVPTLVAVTGTNLPLDGSGYSLPGVPGALVELLFIGSSRTSATLRITAPAGTPSGTYLLRAQAGGATATFPLQIVGGGGGQLGITSVQPSQLQQGAVNAVVVTGSALPGVPSAYRVINRFGQAAAGVQVVAASGGGSQASLQIFVTINALPGNYRLRATSQGVAAEFPITINGVIF